MGWFFSLVWLVGMATSAFVIRARAGVGTWGRIQVFGRNGFGVVWFTTSLIASMFWPITLAVWLARGRPVPRVVFNEKALERERRSASA